MIDNGKIANVRELANILNINESYVARTIRLSVNFTDEFKPTYSSSTTWFKAMLPNLNYSIQVTTNTSVQKSNQKSNQKNSQKIVALIQSNPDVTIASMAEILGLSQSGVKKILAKLRKDKIINRVGSDKSGQWLILSKTD